MSHGRLICPRCMVLIYECVCKDKPIRYDEVCLACKQKEKLEELIKSTERVITPNTFKYWLHESGTFILYGMKYTYESKELIKGFITRTKGETKAELGKHTIMPVAKFKEIPSNVFPAPKRKAQALLWDTDKKRHVITYGGYFNKEQVEKHILSAKAYGINFILSQWPLVVGGIEQWEEVPE